MRHSEALKSRQQELTFAARRRIARELGIHHAALDDKANAMARTRRELGADWAPLKFDTAGILMTRRDLMKLTEIAVSLNHANAALLRASAALRLLRKAQAQPGYEELAERVVALGRDVRLLQPRSACVVCKRIPEVQAKCYKCRGTGYLTLRQLVKLDARLWDQETPHVKHNGRIVPVEVVK